MRSDSRRYLNEARRPAVALLGLLLSLAGALLLLSAPFGYRWELIPLRTALLGMLRWAAYAGIAGVALSLVALTMSLIQRRRGAGMALAGVALGLLSAGIPYAQRTSARRFPPIHDITTDTRVNSPGRRNTLMMRCCDGETETETVRPSRSACDAFARSPAGSGAGGATTVLEGDRPGAVE